MLDPSTMVDFASTAFWTGLPSHIATSIENPRDVLGTRP
jgi:hypothetical protein